MVAAIIPLVISCVIMLAIIKFMNNMLTFGAKKVVDYKEVDIDKKKNYKIWKNIKVPIYIALIILLVMVYVAPSMLVLVGLICCALVISYFEDKNKK